MSVAIEEHEGAGLLSRPPKQGRPIETRIALVVAATAVLGTAYTFAQLMAASIAASSNAITTSAILELTVKNNTQRIDRLSDVPEKIAVIDSRLIGINEKIDYIIADRKEKNK